MRILEALRSGGTNRAEAVVTHHPSATPCSSAIRSSISPMHTDSPQWRLQQANPDVDPGLIDVGQVLTIPSIDVLFPHPPVRGKRIEIDLPTQTLRAYEGDAQRFEFKVSSGISTTPTLAGQFQILFKEEMAFAQRWHLDMPYFMGFYAEGEDFYNGIHELPITSYGTRLSPYVLGWPASYGWHHPQCGRCRSPLQLGRSWNARPRQRRRARYALRAADVGGYRALIEAPAP